MLIGLLLSTSN